MRVIEESAFSSCWDLVDVVVGDKLETIGSSAFSWCTSLRKIELSKVRIIGSGAFYYCRQLTDVELSEDLDRIRTQAFENCPLRRIAMPLKHNLLDDERGDEMFYDCVNLSQVDLVGGTHKTISSLLLESWKNEMNDEIDRINRILPITDSDKTDAIRQCIDRVLERIEHYKNEHYALLKEFTTLLELGLWKVKLDEKFEEASNNEVKIAKKAKIDMKAARQEQRITSGASIVIKNVLPFLKLE